MLGPKNFFICSDAMERPCLRQPTPCIVRAIVYLQLSTRPDASLLPQNAAHDITPFWVQPVMDAQTNAIGVLETGRSIEVQRLPRASPLGHCVQIRATKR